MLEFWESYKLPSASDTMDMLMGCRDQADEERRTHLGKHYQEDVTSIDGQVAGPMG
jgi:hypothetical protein